MNVLLKIEKAAKLLREAALFLKTESDVIELDYEIKIRPQRPRPCLGQNFATEPGKNPPPSK